MIHWNYIAAAAIGAMCGALLMAMIAASQIATELEEFSDAMRAGQELVTKELAEMSRTMREDLIQLPVLKTNRVEK